MSDIVARLELLAPHSEDGAILQEAAQTIRELQGRVEEAASLHLRRPMATTNGHVYACSSCSTQWPCATSTTLTKP